MYHTPMCRWCDGYEVGTFADYLDFCSERCADEAHRAIYGGDEAADDWDLTIADSHRDVIAAPPSLDNLASSY